MKVELTSGWQGFKALANAANRRANDFEALNKRMYGNKDARLTLQVAELRRLAHNINAQVEEYLGA